MNIISKIKHLRRDTGGSVLLLSGTMMFLVVIAVLLNGDMNQGVYDRIQAQNAVDAAAETAALWEARGCNLLQHLNNLHYDGNKILFIAESASLTGCAAAILAVPVAIAAHIWPPALAAANAAAGAACGVCTPAPYIDEGQEYFATAINKCQQLAQNLFPLLTLGYANSVAGEAGADDLTQVIPQYLGSLLDAGGVHWDGLDTVASAMGCLPSIVDVRAVPLTLIGDDKFFEFGVKTQEGDGLPWKTPDWWNTMAQTVYPAAKTECQLPGFDLASVFNSIMGDDRGDKWGWKDKYYRGNPGYMTWVAGKLSRDEVAGLGRLRWLYSDSTAGIEESEKTHLYAKETLNPEGIKLMVPAFLALASSQVEGDPVVSQTDNVNAEGKIIAVYMPLPSYKNPKRGDKLLIYH